MNTNANIKQGYKQTSLGILPQEWEVVRLGDICELFAGGDAPKEHFSKLKTAHNTKFLFLATESALMHFMAIQIKLK